MRQEIAKIWTIARAYVQWLVSPRLVWFTAIIFALALTYGFWRPASGVRIERAGALLQLVGTVMGFWALRATRKLFKMPSLTDEVRAWIGRRPRRNITMPLEAGAFSMSGASVKLSTWRSMGSDLDVQARIDALVANVEELKSEAAGSNQEHRAAIAKLRTDMESKTHAIEEGLSGTTLTLHESQTGGLWPAWVALAMLFVGTVLVNFPTWAAETKPMNGVPNHWLEKFWSDPITTFTGLLSIATVGLIVTGIFQWRALMATVKAMREDSMATHRPEISILSFEPSHEGIEEEKIAVQVMYVNRGRSTAKNVRIQAKITNRRFPLQTGISLSGPGAIDLAHPNLASGIKNYFLITSEIPAKSATVHQVRENRGQDTPKIVCIGCISYFDGMNGRKETGFCRVFNDDNDRWEPSGNTEYEYSY